MVILLLSWNTISNKCKMNILWNVRKNDKKKIRLKNVSKTGCDRQMFSFLIVIWFHCTSFYIFFNQNAMHCICVLMCMWMRFLHTYCVCVCCIFILHAIILFSNGSDTGCTSLCLFVYLTNVYRHIKQIFHQPNKN